MLTARMCGAKGTRGWQGPESYIHRQSFSYRVLNIVRSSPSHAAASYETSPIHLFIMPQVKTKGTVSVAETLLG